VDLLIVRHGPAGTREAFAMTGQSDDLRPLTDDGIRQFTKAARGLHRIVNHIDAIATSPFVRAQQTAVILGERYAMPVVETEVLLPDAPYTKFAPWIKKSTTANVVAIVGHEPHLSGLVAWLIGDKEARIELKKGAACLVRLDRTVQRGAGTLRWLLAPDQLRAIHK
jgi:phosphohistidine phosphatase